MRRLINLFLALLLAGCGGGSDEAGGSGGGVAVGAPSALSYSNAPTFALGSPIVPLNPTVVGPVAGYTIAPSLPAGLAFNALTGQIAGTPLSALPPTVFTIVASNTSGSTSYALTLTVLAPPAGLAYQQPGSLLKDSPMLVLSPTVSGSVDTFRVAPSLPQGLVLDTISGAISGSPTLLQPASAYVITAQNAAGSISFTLSISVVRQRFNTDQPDTSGSPHQVHLIYAVPVGGADRQLDRNGALDSSILSANRWMIGATTGGQRFRLDQLVDQGVDVTFVQLANNDSFYASSGSTAVDKMASEIRIAPWYSASKTYLIYYEGTNSSACATAQIGGHFAAHYLQGMVGAIRCDLIPFATTGTSPAAYREWLVLHEIVHTLGFVSPCSPNFTTALPGHTGDNPEDLMWGPTFVGDGRVWRPNSIDPGNDDYYGSSIPGTCAFNLFQSAFLEPQQGNQLPPGFL